MTPSSACGRTETSVESAGSDASAAGSAGGSTRGNGHHRLIQGRSSINFLKRIVMTVACTGGRRRCRGRRGVTSVERGEVRELRRADEDPRVGVGLLCGCLRVGGPDGARLVIGGDSAQMRLHAYRFVAIDDVGRKLGTTTAPANGHRFCPLAANGHARGLVRPCSTPKSNRQSLRRRPGVSETVTQFASRESKFGRWCGIGAMRSPLATGGRLTTAA